MSDSLEEYQASHRSPAIVNHNGSDRENGRLFAIYKEKLVIIDGENKKAFIHDTQDKGESL